VVSARRSWSVTCSRQFPSPVGAELAASPAPSVRVGSRAAAPPPTTRADGRGRGGWDRFPSPTPRLSSRDPRHAHREGLDLPCEPQRTPRRSACAMAAFATSWLTRGATGRGRYSFIDPAVMLHRANAPQISHTCKINSERFVLRQNGAQIVHMCQ
jgi:hypothetical protein